MPQDGFGREGRDSKWVTLFRSCLIPVGSTSHSARFSAFFWALVQSGAYFKAQNGRSPLIRTVDGDEMIEMF